MTGTPTPTQTPGVQVNESQASDEITIDEGANQLYDPKTGTVFFLNNFGYVTTRTHYSEEELRKRWNEIMTDLGRNTAQEEQKEDNAPSTSIPPDDDIPESTIQDTDSGYDLGNLLLEDDNVEEPPQKTTDEEDTSLEMILSQTDETENEEDQKEDENPLSGSLSLDLAGALTGVVSEDTSQDSPEEKVSNEADNRADSGDNKLSGSPELDNMAFFSNRHGVLMPQVKISSLFLRIIRICAQVQDQIDRYVDIYEKDYPNIDINEIGAYDDETLSELFIDGVIEIGTTIYKIPNNPLGFPQNVAEAIRDNVMGTRTLISEKGREFLKETKKLEMQGVPHEDACERVWYRIYNNLSTTESYQLELLQDLIQREKGVTIEQYILNSYKEVYKQLRRHDEDLISYEQKENAKIRAPLQFILNEKIRKLKEEREK
jgi:hypothetical protein